MRLRNATSSADDRSTEVLEGSRNKTVSDPPRMGPAQDVELVAGTVVGEYRIESLIGRGGMATVYAAVHAVLGKQVAIKIMNGSLSSDPAAVQRFVQEARAIATLRHPNIVDVFGFGHLADGRAYFVMERLAGESLSQRIATGPLPVSEIVDIAVQVIDALEAVHARGLVHRDLKPANIFALTTSGGRPSVRLLDFGIAKLVDAKAGDVAVTGRGFVIGTPGYVAPEQILERDVDTRADIYALGTTLYSLATTRLPFVGESAMELLTAQVRDEPTPLGGVTPVPDAFAAIVHRMLEKTPEARPTLAEARRQLRRLRTPTSALGEALGRTPVLVKRGLQAAGAAVLILAAGTLVARYHHSEPPAASAVREENVPEVKVPELVPGLLVVSVNVPNARIVMDSRVVAEAAGGARLSVADNGEHVLDVVAPGFVATRQVVRIAPGTTVDVPVTLHREVVKAKSTPQRRPSKTPSKTKTRRDGDYTMDPFK